MKELIDNNGFYGVFGGAFVPEMLKPKLSELKQASKKILASEKFQEDLNQLLKDYVGRPTPLYFAKNLSEKYGCKVYLKKEDLCHTGAHKINNTIAQALLAKALGKKNIIAETGAGQHGVATATACALLGLKCTVYMGEKDISRQSANVQRMNMLGAKVIPASSGSKTLKDATNEAIRAWINQEDAYYIIGSVVGPDPYPSLVADFQAIISKEIRQQLKEEPDYIIACIGGGSNAAGAFYHFIDCNTQLIGVEAAGKGIHTQETAASLKLGSLGVLHGSMSYLMQDEDGQIIEPHSISAGLDYPGIGPVHAYLNESGKVQYTSITDQEAVTAGNECCLLEGIIPALESAHALAQLKKMSFKSSDTVVINLSGRGDKDLNNYQIANR